MSGHQALVGAAGIGLVITNAWLDDRTQLSGLFGTGDLGEAHKAAKALGMELLGVGALVLLAGGSGSAANAALAIIACLWIVWYMRHNGNSPIPHSTGPATNGGFGHPKAA